ncbi:MAG: acyltransferase family protein [Lachnospiraceae bacterium]|nr:acyltransferase family protein [Lachnospiraceae bacterium]
MRDERNYGVDALRILAMLMVVVTHILGVGGVFDACEPLSPQYGVAWFLEAACYCTVNCYALISGYAGINASYKYSNIVLLWLRVVFYTVSITVLFGIFKPEAVRATDYIKAFFPVMKSPYWYFTAYFALFLFIPILNKAINAMTREQVRAVVIGAVIFISVFQTVFGDVFGTAEGSSTLWLIVLYMIGAYIRKFDPFKSLTAGKALLGYLITTTLSWGFKVAADAAPLLLGEDNGFAMLISSYSDRLIRHISPTLLASAVLLLILFRQLSIPDPVKRMIKFLSPMAFSVYIIHAHPLVWDNFMDYRFSSYSLLPAPALAIAVLGTALFIFAVCCICDMMRIFIFKRLKIKKRLEELEKKYIGALW